MPPLDFIGVANEIVGRQPGLNACIPVVQKELLHMEILGGLHDAGILRHLVFKGGTCLRLCHGSDRFSEDLDFSGGSAFTPALLENVEDVLRERIGRAYGLEVDVRHAERKPGRTVNRWVARVVTYRPEGSRSTANIGVQRIKIEIDDQPHPEHARAQALTHPYKEIVGAYAVPLVVSMPMGNILSDKLVAFPQSLLRRHNPRYRDVWDMHWLAPELRRERHAIFNRANETAEGQGWSADAYADARANAVSRLPGVVDSDAFADTMRRFLDSSLFERTVGDPRYRAHIVEVVLGLLEHETLEIGPRPPETASPAGRRRRRPPSDPPDF